MFKFKWTCRLVSNCIQTFLIYVKSAKSANNTWRGAIDFYIEPEALGEHKRLPRCLSYLTV